MNQPVCIDLLTRTQVVLVQFEITHERMNLEKVTDVGDGNWSFIACSTHHTVIKGPPALALFFLVIYSALANILLVGVQFHLFTTEYFMTLYLGH